MGVSDLVTIFHIGQYTYREDYGGRADDGLDLYTMQAMHRYNFDWNFEKSGLKEEHYELDNKKCLYGRNNSLKMGRMPATPDEGYHNPDPNAKRQWFRNQTQWDIHNERERIAQETYLKKKGLI